MDEGPRRPLRPGDPIPEFRAVTAGGRPFGRDDLLGHRTVLFFYPKANSLGCSLEARAFAQHREALARAGWTVVGVSVDPPDAQARFQQQCELPFELLSDPDGSVSRAFGVLGRLGRASRTTFWLRPDGQVASVLHSWRPRRHVFEALARPPGRPP